MRRITFTSLLLLIATGLLAGCSYRAQFILVNESGVAIKVTYQLHKTDKMFPFPMLGISTMQQFQEHNNYDELPRDRVAIDIDNLIYRVELRDREILFLTMADIRDISDEPVFKAGLSEVSIRSDSGSVSYSGDKVFAQFAPSRRAIWPGPPLLYTMTYK